MAVVATLSKGYDLDYIWKQVDRGLAKDPAGYYIQASETGGEPPGRWWGPGAKALGMEPGQVVEREPYDLLFREHKAPDGTLLGKSPGSGRKAADIYATLLAAESHATAERKQELRLEATRQARQSPLFFDLTVSVSECDTSKVSRIETGQRGIRAKELRELLGEYSIDGEQLDILTLLADPRGAFGWHRAYDDVLPGAWRDYLILETAATRIWAYEAQRIPGLLQTPAYARALAETDLSLEDGVARDRAAEAVTARQQAILREHKPQVRLVIGQAALHQQVGSPEVMNEQLHQVAQVAADSGTVTVQVLPFESGAHAAAGDGALAVLQFTGTAGLGLVHLGGVAGGVCLEGRGDLVAYAEAFDQLRAFALSPAQSALLIRGLAGL